MSPGINALLADLANADKPLLSTTLAELSRVNSTELKQLEQFWPTIKTERRRKIVNRMVELAESNFELTFDSIFKIALKDSDEDIRIKAIEGLWEDEEPALINPLIKLLNEDSSEKVQASAATALGKFAMLAELKKLRASYISAVTKALLASLEDKGKPAEVRRRAIESAAPLSLPQVKNAIDGAYQSNDLELRASAVFAMGKSCDPGWLPTLLKELGNGNPRIRYEAVNACGELCDKDAVPQLIKLVEDKDIEVRLAAIQALGKIGGALAKRYLKKSLESPDDAVSQAAEEALQIIEAEDPPF